MHTHTHTFQYTIAEHIFEKFVYSYAVYKRRVNTITCIILMLLLSLSLSFRIVSLFLLACIHVFNSKTFVIEWYLGLFGVCCARAVSVLFGMCTCACVILKISPVRNCVPHISPIHLLSLTANANIVELLSFERIFVSLLDSLFGAVVLSSKVIHECILVNLPTS